MQKRFIIKKKMKKIDDFKELEFKNVTFKYGGTKKMSFKIYHLK